MQEKINVLHLRDSPWVDGPGRTILESATIIDNNRFNYIIGAFCNHSEKACSLVEAAVKRDLNVVSIIENGSLDLNVISTINKLIIENNIDILHTHEIRSNLYGIVCAKMNRIKLVTTLHGWIGNNLKSKIMCEFDKMLLHFFNLIIVVSEQMKGEATKYGLKSSKIILLRNSIIPDKYVPNSSDDSFRKELNISRETILVGNIGRLSPEKGQADFIKAASIVLKHEPNIKFLVIGTGPDQIKLKDMCVVNNLQDAFIFTGYHDDMKRVYNSLDLVVQTSYTEGMPNVILESLLMEVPVIASRVGGTSEIIANETLGTLFESGNTAVLNNLIIDFIRNPHLYIAKTKFGRNHVKCNFNFLWRTRRLSELYIELMS